MRGSVGVVLLGGVCTGGDGAGADGGVASYGGGGCSMVKKQNPTSYFSLTKNVVTKKLFQRNSLGFS